MNELGGRKSGVPLRKFPVENWQIRCNVLAVFKAYIGPAEDAWAAVAAVNHERPAPMERMQREKVTP